MEKSKELQENDEMWATVFRSTFHDLRNPINNAFGFVSMLAGDFNAFSQEEKKTFLQKAYSGIKRSVELLDEFSSWSDELLDGAHHKEMISLDGLVTDEVRKFRDEIEKKWISVNAHGSGLLYAHKRTMEFVFRNLLSNAVKYTKVEGAITVVAIQDEKEVRISIADSGVGISEDKIKALFTFGESVPGTAGETGRGKGLTLAKWFLDREGGSISVESIEGEGAIFCITFPKLLSD